MIVARCHCQGERVASLDGLSFRFYSEQRPHGPRFRNSDRESAREEVAEDSPATRAYFATRRGDLLCVCPLCGAEYEPSAVLALLRRGARSDKRSVKLPRVLQR